MTSGQLRFDGRVVSVVRLDVPGFGKVSYDLDADDPKLRTGDRIEATVQYVVVHEDFGEDHTPDGYAKEEPGLVYKVQAVRPFRLERVIRKADIDAAWMSRISADA